MRTKLEANYLFEVGIYGVQGRHLQPERFYYTDEARELLPQHIQDAMMY